MTRPIYQAFTIGRVRFVITDARSEHTADSLLGERQTAWLLDELRTASATHAAVVWVNSVPWVGPAAVGADGWAGHPEERAMISEAIARSGIDNLVMVSGDAHMVAIDDGTNTDYSVTGGAGFPLLHAAALDRPGNVKGGPYSEGAFPGGGQYGVLDVVDHGGPTIELVLSGRTWDGRHAREPGRRDGSLDPTARRLSTPPPHRSATPAGPRGATGPPDDPRLASLPCQRPGRS